MVEEEIGEKLSYKMVRGNGGITKLLACLIRDPDCGGQKCYELMLMLA